MHAKALKGIAIATMVMDHLTWAFVPLASGPGQIMHSIGRITGPIMFFFIAEGYAHTRNVKKYAARLAIFAAISQLPYIYFWTGKLPTLENLLPGNILFTLLLGLLAIWAVEKQGRKPHTLLIIIALCIINIPCDWSYWGILLILAFHLSNGKPQQRCTFVLLITITRFLWIWSAETIPGTDLYQLAIPWALPLLHCYNGHRGKGGKWLFYIFYPAHLLIIGFLKWGLLT